MTEDPTGELAGRYDRQARAYREHWAPVLREGAKKLLDELADARPRCVLDAGTGVGALLPDLRARFPEAFLLGVDRSPGMLALASGDVPRALMDASRLGLAAASVDLVLLVFMLFHLPRPLDGLREARRVLCARGHVATVTWQGEFDSRATELYKERLGAHGAPELGPGGLAQHELVDTPAKMQALFARAGFSRVHTWEEELVYTLELEPLLQLKTSRGRQLTRLEELEPDARAAFLADVRARLEALAPEDFVMRGTLVYAIAS